MNDKLHHSSLLFTTGQIVCITALISAEYNGYWLEKENVQIDESGIQYAMHIVTNYGDASSENVRHHMLSARPKPKAKAAPIKEAARLMNSLGELPLTPSH